MQNRKRLFDVPVKVKETPMRRMLKFALNAAYYHNSDSIKVKKSFEKYLFDVANTKVFTITHRRHSHPKKAN